MSLMGDFASYDGYRAQFATCEYCVQINEDTGLDLPIDHDAVDCNLAEAQAMRYETRQNPIPDEYAEE